MDLQKDSERGRKRTLTHFTRALKDAGLLLPMAVRENQEVTVSSRNICEQGRWPKTEARSVGLTKAPIILLHWLGWRACFELVFELVWVTRPRPLGQVVLLALSSDRPTEFRSLASVPAW